MSKASLFDMLPQDVLKRIRENIGKAPGNTCPFCWGTGLVDAIKIGDPYNYEKTFICDCSDGFPRNREPLYKALPRWSLLLHGKYAVKGHAEYVAVLEANLTPSPAKDFA